MLHFSSANVRIANSDRAAEECLDILFPDDIPSKGILIVNASLGHRLHRLASSFARHIPEWTVLGSSCSGVTGREGVGESMSDLATMAIWGEPGDYAVACVNDIYGDNAYAKAHDLAVRLKEQAPAAHTIYLLCPGIDIANDLVLNAFDDVFGEAITIFGGTSSDNMRGLISQQYLGDTLSEHGAWAIAFADPSLKAITRATHGFSAYGEPMVVTKAEGHRILELNGKPAWQEYTSRLGLTPAPDTICGETIPVGALAEALPANLAAEYGNPHILRVITKYDSDGTIYYPTTCSEGLKLWLTTRDESLIFSEMERTLAYLKQEVGPHQTVAVFQTDCLARGRFLFNRIMKDEIIAMMHTTLSNEEGVPPWLGMYGFGEYARLGARNAYHNYSSALLVLYR